MNLVHNYVQSFKSDKPKPKPIEKEETELVEEPELQEIFEVPLTELKTEKKNSYKNSLQITVYSSTLSLTSFRYYQLCATIHFLSFSL